MGPGVEVKWAGSEEMNGFYHRREASEGPPDALTQWGYDEAMTLWLGNTQGRPWYQKDHIQKCPDCDGEGDGKVSLCVYCDGSGTQTGPCFIYPDTAYSRASWTGSWLICDGDGGSYYHARDMGTAQPPATGWSTPYEGG